ncbi:hypothetical protein ABZ357_00385 [Streptomyces sp. NPDC005917]
MRLVPDDGAGRPAADNVFLYVQGAGGRMPEFLGAARTAVPTFGF